MYSSERVWFVEEEEEDEEESFTEESFTEDSMSFSDSCSIIDPSYTDPVGLPNPSHQNCFLSAPVQCMLASPVLRVVFTDPKLQAICTLPMKGFAELANQMTEIGQVSANAVLSEEAYQIFLDAVFPRERADWCGEAQEAVSYLTRALTEFPTNLFSVVEEKFSWVAPSREQWLGAALELGPKMVSLEDSSKYMAVSWRDVEYRVQFPGPRGNVLHREIYAAGQGTSLQDIFFGLEQDSSWFSTWVEMSNTRRQKRKDQALVTHQMQFTPLPVLLCGGEPRRGVIELGNLWVESFHNWAMRDGREEQQRVVYYPPTGWISFTTGTTPSTLALPIGRAIVSQPVNPMQTTLQGALTQEVRVIPDAYVVHVGEYHWVAVFQTGSGDWWVADDAFVAPLSQATDRWGWDMDGCLLLVQSRNVLALVRNTFSTIPGLPADMEQRIARAMENIESTMRGLQQSRSLQ